ncbi:protein TIME FOR COFFEE-like isoform X2 [Phoenix dactylifera]|uniref:Protein TIME FOR COFFEE-like isoform X2 n=1 Tax=Phoenix dactylifera TaxID=42345 RepID=A0A8B8J597_PHODC|nr:protein TIME FOR COFFEE-like isoform X2 [Phoenix dactylifera]
MVESSRLGAEMERNREGRRRTPYSFRRRSRGAEPRESSGILDVEHIRNNSIKEKFGSRELRSSSRTRRRPCFNERRANHGKEVADRSSDESLEEGDECNQGRASRVKPEYKVSKEMIGVSVPRRARSACAKRPQESFAVLRHSSCSSPVHNGATSSSSPSSNASMKARGGMVSISESEVEVAQVLCGLKKPRSQHSPAKSENFQSAQLDFCSNLSDERYVSIVSISSSLASTPISLTLSSQPTFLSNHSTITPETGTVPKKKMPRNLQSDDAEKPSVMIACNSKPNEDSIEENDANSLHTFSIIENQEDKNLHITETRTSLPKLEKEVLPNGDVYSRIAGPWVPQNPILLPLQVDEKPNSTNPVSVSPKQKPDSDFLKKDDGCSGTNFQAALEQTNQMIEKEENPSKQNLPSFPSLDDKLDVHNSISPVSASVEGVKGIKFEIDMMGHVTHESHDKSKVIVNLAEKMAMQGPKAKKDSDIIEQEKKSQIKKEAAEAAILVKQPLISGKIRSCHDVHNQNKVNMIQNPQKTPEGTTSPADRMGKSTGIRTSTSTPIPMTIPIWPGGHPPFGFLDCSLPIPRAHQEPEEGKSAIPYMPFVIIPPRRPGHCTTHCFIAQFIYFQQQLAKINPLWHATGSSLCNARPCSLSIMPQSGTSFLGGPVVKNLDFLPQNNFGPTFGGPVVMNPKAIGDPKICQPSLPHLAHQGATFVSPINHSRAAGPKDSEDFSSFSTSGAPCAASFSASSNFSNFAATRDPRYFTMFQSCPFPLPPGYHAHLSQQQQLPPPPLPSNSSQSFQLQSQSFQQSQNSAASIGSSSLIKHLKLPPCFPPSKPLSGACHNETEDEADSNVSLSQKKLQLVTPTANIVGKQHDLGDSQMSLKTVKVDRPFEPRQEIGSHHHDQLRKLQKQPTYPLKAHNSIKSSMPNKVQKQSAPCMISPNSALSAFVSTEASMACNDCNALTYYNSSGSVALHNTKHVQCKMPLSQKMPNPETSLVDVSRRKVRPMPPVSTHPVQAQSSAKAKRPLIPKSDPGNHNSAVHVMFAGSSKTRKHITNQ